MQEVSYKVVRSDRKSIALVIDNEANLVVRAPRAMRDDSIADFVKRKRRWINEKRKQVDVFGEKHSKVEDQTGESIMYMGNSYAIVQDDVYAVTISGNEILVPQEFSLDDMSAWLKEEAKRIISERALRYASIMGVVPGEIKLSEAKARWGSCSAKNNLNFAWRLVMCPLSVIDYVVVHELSHITYKNHSPAFWARVKTLLPDYEDRQDWLRLNKRIMDII